MRADSSQKTPERESYAAIISVPSPSRWYLCEGNSLGPIAISGLLGNPPSTPTESADCGPSCELIARLFIPCLQFACFRIHTLLLHPQEMSTLVSAERQRSF